MRSHIMELSVLDSGPPFRRSARVNPNPNPDPGMADPRNGGRYGEGDDSFSRVGAVKPYEGDYRYEPENFDPHMPFKVIRTDMDRLCDFRITYLIPFPR